MNPDLNEPPEKVAQGQRQPLAGDLPDTGGREVSQPDRACGPRHVLLDLCNGKIAGTAHTNARLS